MASTGRMNNGKDPYFWRESAVTALKSAQLLFTEYDLARKRVNEATRKLNAGQAALIQREDAISEKQIYPALMMMGFAIENALKGIIVADDTTLVSSDRVEKNLKTHNLRNLAETADITLDDAEAGLLEMLEYYVTWSGRYPIPLSDQAYQKFYAGRKLKFPMDFELSVSIFNKIDAVLTQKPPFHDLSVGTSVYE